MHRDRLAAPRPLALLLFALALLLGGCVDSALDPFRDRSAPYGLVISEGGSTVVREDKEGRVSGKLTVAAGKRSGVLEVTFLDRDGNRIAPAADEYLEVDVTFGDVAAFEQSAKGVFSGRLVGIAPGSTSAIFKLKYGGVLTNWNSSAIDIVITR